MEKFLAAVRNMFNVPDLRKRILFTLGLLAVYRLGAHIGAPGINKERLDAVWREVAGTLLGVLDLFSGGNFRTISVFALGVTPYITASIILQLMTVVSPQLKKLQEEGEMGRQKINQWTRYLTVALSMVQTWFVAHWLQINGVGANTWGFLFTIILTLTTGTIFVMWLGEQITERGIGNGISLLIFSGIVIGLPRGVQQVLERMRGGDTLEAVGATRGPTTGWWSADHYAVKAKHGRRHSRDFCIVSSVDAAKFVRGVPARPQQSKHRLGQGLHILSNFSRERPILRIDFSDAYHLFHLLLRFHRFQRRRSGG
jgi:preprotein translocase subunit SecY